MQDQPNISHFEFVAAINADAEEFSDNLNKTVVENIPKFYDNFHWERPTLLNETLNELPLKDVVNQAINDQVGITLPCLLKLLLIEISVPEQRAWR